MRSTHHTGTENVRPSPRKLKEVRESKMKDSEDSLDGPMVKNLCANTGDLSWVQGQEDPMPPGQPSCTYNC